MTRKTDQAEHGPRHPEFAGVGAFETAEPFLQDAIVAAIGSADPVHLYPSRIAFLEGWAPVEQDVSRADAAHLLAHIPPPFYTTAEAATVGGLLAERPTD